MKLTIIEKPVASPFIAVFKFSINDVRCGKPASSIQRPASSIVFTLIELLAVIAIISILAALLLPALRRAKDMAWVVNCMSNQKQMGVALASYAGDFTEYPTNYDNDIGAVSANYNDECAGVWYGSPPSNAYESDYVPNQSPAFPGWTYSTGAWHRLAGNNYVPCDPWIIPTGINNCTGKLPDGWTYNGGGYRASFGLYSYNGPHSRASCVGNNSQLSGLYVMGRHDKGVEWGVRLFGTLPAGFTWSQIAFLACPSLYDGTGVMREPHGFQPACGGAGQLDASGPSLAFYHYDRNYLFGDLHAEYLHAASRAGIP